MLLSTATLLEKVGQAIGIVPQDDKRSRLRTQADLDAALATQRDANAAYVEFCRKVETGETYKGDAAGRPLYAAKLRADALVEAIRKEVDERANSGPFEQVEERRRLSKAKGATIGGITKLKELIASEQRLLAGHLNDIEKGEQSLKVCASYQRPQVESEIARSKRKSQSCQLEITRLTVELEQQVALLAKLEREHAAIVNALRS